MHGWHEAYAGCRTLDDVLRENGLRSVFQPIVDVSTGSPHVYAHEGLSRGPAGSHLEPADVLFACARLRREEGYLDRACIRLALKEAAALPDRRRLCLNVHASTLGLSCGFVAFFLDAAEAAGRDPSELTVEIVEHSPFWEGTSFQSALKELREEGVSIALDDVGLGQSNFRMMLDCRPSYFKVDRYFVRGAHADELRQSVLLSISRLDRDFGASTVAEGVEDEADLATVRMLGATLVQGYYFSQPLPAAEVPAEAALRAKGAS